MRRSLLRGLGSCALLACLSGLASHASGQISLCTSIGNNNNFAQGFAFWTVNPQNEKIGTASATNVIQADPLAFLPSNGNIATFFPEATASWDCNTPLLNAGSSTTALSRVVLWPGGTPNFQWGGTLSFTLSRGGTAQYSVRLRIQDLDNGREYCCVLREGVVTSTSADNLRTGTINLGTLNTASAPCCEGAPVTGNRVRISIIVQLQALVTARTQEAFIGGVTYFDNFQGCNILCATPIDPREVVPALPLNTAGGEGEVTIYAGDRTAVEAFDVNGDGIVGPVDYLDLARREAKPVLNGDTNFDGVLSQDDLRLIIDAMVGEGSAAGTKAADVNGDGYIDDADVDAFIKSQK